MGKIFSFCLFYFKQKIHFGLLVERKKKSFIQDSNRDYFIEKKSLFFVFEEELKKTPPLQHLKNKKEELKNFSLDLITIYQLCELKKIYSLQELADFSLSNPNDPWQKAFLAFFLFQEKKLFSFEKNGFIKNNKKVITAKEKKESLIKEEKSWAKQLVKNHLPEIKKEEEKRWLVFKEKIQKFCFSYQEYPEKEYFKKIFSLSKEKEKLEKQLLFLLHLLENSISWEEFQIKKAGIYEEDSKAELVQAKKIIQTYKKKIASQNFNKEKDLCCFTIDSEKTKDFDDAISLKEEKGGYFIRLHISNLADFILPNTPLSSRIEEKISSVYTLIKNYHLLPTLLAEGIFSLKKNQQRFVFTFEWLFDKNYNLISKKIYPSEIVVKENISYHTLNEWIEKKKEWSFLYQICKNWQQSRIEQGSLSFEREEISLDISNPNKIKLIKENIYSPSYIIVSELAIQSNNWAAQLFIEKGYTAIFRKQPPYKNLSQKTKNLKLEDYSIPAAYFSLQSDTHWGLGLAHYAQVTSPIRRFQDFINQKILLCIINNTPHPFEKEYLFFILEKIEKQSIQYTQLEKKILAHWKKKYLFQNKEEKFWIKVIRKQKNKILVNFLDLQLSHLVIAPPLEIKKTYLIKIKKIDLEKEWIEINL